MFERVRALMQPDHALCRDARTLGGRPSFGQVDGEWTTCMDGVPPSNCTVYSVGSDNDFSWDEEMATRGCAVHTFDPTSNAPASTSLVHFYPVGLGAVDAESAPVNEPHAGARRHATGRVEGGH